MRLREWGRSNPCGIEPGATAGAVDFSVYAFGVEIEGAMHRNAPEWGRRGTIGGQRVGHARALPYSLGHFPDDGRSMGELTPPTRAQRVGGCKSLGVQALGTVSGSRLHGRDSKTRGVAWR